MPITIISSLYRVESHLPQFTQAVLSFAEAIHQAGIEVHYLPIVNDASPTEKEIIDTLTQQINNAGYSKMTAHYIERETLYATWNRGIALSQTPYFTFWNADDIRDSSAFIEGYRALEAGATLVDFDFTNIKTVNRFGLFPTEVKNLSPMLYRVDPFTPKNGVGPFFMVNRDLYEQVGAFDENFRVTGDLEWASRTLPYVNFYPAKQIGGDFYIHGDNLSNTGTNREDIEVNIVFMRREDWYRLIPVDPNAMQTAWNTWGNPHQLTVPDDVAEFLWGDASQTRWKQFQRERNQAQWLQKLRYRLASRGWMKSAEWDVYLHNKQNRLQ